MNKCLTFGRKEKYGLRRLTVSLHRCWTYFGWIDEAGMATLQLGPVIFEFVH